MKIVALIGARSGSSLKDKNIRNYNGLPLLLHSVNQGLESKYITEIYVSTDSEKYAKIVKDYNSEIKVIMRPSEISGDLSNDYDFFKHYIDSIDNKPTIIVQLRPTYPNRNANKIDECIKIFIENIDNYDSLRSVISLDKSAFKMYIKNENSLIPFKNDGFNELSEPYNQARQMLPQTYLHNGYIDIIKVESLIKKKSITGDNIMAYVMNDDENCDIDTLEDWEKSLNKHKND